MQGKLCGLHALMYELVRFASFCLAHYPPSTNVLIPAAHSRQTVSHKRAVLVSVDNIVLRQLTPDNI